MKKKEPSVAMKKMDKIVYNISKFCSYAGGVGVGAVMIIAVIDVIMAKLLKASYPSATEWITYLNILIVFAPLAYVQLERGHTQVDMLEGKVPYAVTKTIRVCSMALSAVVFWYMTRCGFRLVAQQIASGEKSSSDAFAVNAFYLWMFGIIFVIGCILAMISFIWSIVREFTGLSIFDQQTEKKENAAKNSAEHKVEKTETENVVSEIAANEEEIGREEQPK